MKKKFTLLFIGFFLTFLSYSQMQVLSSLASGILIHRDILFDENDRLYGYIYLFESSRSDSVRNIEYVLLDKNLNKVLNGNFDSPIPNRKLSSSKYQRHRFINSTLIGDQIMLTGSYEHLKARKLFDSTLEYCYQFISLKDGSVSSEYTFRNGTIRGEIANGDSLYKTYSKNKNAYKRTYVPMGFSNSNVSGIFMLERSLTPSFNSEIHLFGLDNELKWKYSYNPNPTKENFIHLNILAMGRKVFYVKETTYMKNKMQEVKICAIDYKTGVKRYEYVLQGEAKNLYHHKYIDITEVDNGVVITGNIYRYAKRENAKLLLNNYSNYIYYSANFRADYANLGAFRTQIDSLGRVVQNKYSKWNELGPLLPLSSKKELRNQYYLEEKFRCTLNDGTIHTLNEMVFSRGASTRTRDFLLCHFDNTFTLVKVDSIRKNLTFSQYNTSDFEYATVRNDNNGFMFVYRDDVTNNQKIKAVLGINTYLNGDLVEEKIALTDENIEVDVMPARDGYILFKEYNRLTKQGQLRLEKLNY